MITFRRRMLLVSLGFAAHHAAHAQAAPSTIPTVLATSILSDYSNPFGGALQFSVGKPIAGWPAGLVPPAPATLVGGSALGSIHVLVVSYPRGANALAAVGAHLLESGFSAPSPAAGGDTSEHGFVRESTSPAVTVGRIFCGKTGGVMGIQPVDSTATTVTISMVYVDGAGLSSACNGNPSGIGGSKPPLAVPVLFPPAGVAAQPGGSGFSDVSIQSSARIDTTFSSDALLAHYSRQLTSAGWQVNKVPANGDGVSGVQLTARDERGQEWRGALVIFTAAGQRQLLLTMMRDRKE